MPPPSFELSNLDAVRWLQDQPAESIDLLITDPAYESLEKHRAIGTTTRLKHSKASSNDWFRSFRTRGSASCSREAYACCGATRTSTCSATPRRCSSPSRRRSEAGFKFWKPLVWDKRTIGMGYHYRARYEFILFFEKGKRRLNDLGIADMISVPRVRGGYPAEKPAEVAEVLIGQSSAAGRDRRRSVHGVGQRRRRGAAARAPVPRQRSQSRSGATARRSGCASSATAACPPDIARRHAAGSAGTAAARSPHCAHDRRRIREPGRVVRVAPVRRRAALKVYREIRVGKTIIGKNRCIDIFCVSDDAPQGVRDRVQVPGQPGHGRREDPVRARRPAGAADGRLHRLRRPADSPTACCTCCAASRHAAYCLPVADQAAARPKRSELDHLLAAHFGWWDVLVGKKKPVSATSASTAQNGSTSPSLDFTDTFLNDADFQQ